MNVTCNNEMDTTPCTMSAYTDPRIEYDAIAEIMRQESRRAQARKNARKQRARELTKARELEIKTKGGVK